MTRGELFELAKQAGGRFDGSDWRFTCDFDDEALTHFAALVATKEREACAVLCDEMLNHYTGFKDTALLNGDVALSNAASGESRACEFLASAIRARGAKQ